MGIIYKATNIQNGKCYIGQTTSPLNTRVYHHFRNARISDNKNYFYRALNKYDKEDWTWDILVEADDKELDRLERFYVSKFKSFGEGGYNSTIGGSWDEKGSPTYNSTVHRLYNGELIIEGTLSEIAKTVKTSYSNLQKFLAGFGKRCGSLVRECDREDYDFIMCIFTLHHNTHGTCRYTAKEIRETLGFTSNDMLKIKNGLSVKGWEVILKDNLNYFQKKLLSP